MTSFGVTRWSPEHGHLSVFEPERSAGPSEVVADVARRCTFDRDHPERVGAEHPSYSLLHVILDFDLDDRLCGVEIIGLPTTRVEAHERLAELEERARLEDSYRSGAFE